MIEVNIKDNESLERALRRFKKKWERSGVLKDVKRKAFYEKPSVTKRIAKKIKDKKKFLLKLKYSFHELDFRIIEINLDKKKFFFC